LCNFRWINRKPSSASPSLPLTHSKSPGLAPERPSALGRPAGGKIGTTNAFTDAWFIGFTLEITAGVRICYDDKSVSLGKPETGAVAALPIWLEFMQGALNGKPVQAFQNVVPLEKVALTKNVMVDMPNSAPTEAGEGPTALDAAPASAPTVPETIPPGGAPAKATLRRKLHPRPPILAARPFWPDTSP
jgi:penicillin-binding protein 1A